MALSDDNRRKFDRCVAEMRRGKIGSRDMAADLLARLALVGLEVAVTEPDLGAMVETLQAAGYQVVPP